MEAYELLGPGSVSIRSAHQWNLHEGNTHIHPHTHIWAHSSQLILYTLTTSLYTTSTPTPTPTVLQLYATFNPPIAGASQSVRAPALRTTRTARAPRSTACPGLAADGERLERTRPVGAATPLISPVAPLQQRIRHRVRATGAPAAAAGTPGDGGHRSRSNPQRCGAEAVQ